MEPGGGFHRARKTTGPGLGRRSPVGRRLRFFRAWSGPGGLNVRLSRERLGREVEAEHAAVHFVHVDEAAGDFVLAVDLLDAADGEPADPLVLGLRGAGRVALDEGADAGVGGELEAD